MFLKTFMNKNKIKGETDKCARTGKGYKRRYGRGGGRVDVLRAEEISILITVGKYTRGTSYERI